MLRSMYSGISGMKNFQTKLDVIGNNIANVNTFGYKKGRVTFKDTMNQMISGASAAQNGRGGKNPIQIGLGSQIASIDTIDTQSGLQTTGRALDLAVSGDGYFIVKQGNQQYYTRAGNFYLDNNGTLVNADGYKVQAYPYVNGNLSNNYGAISINVNGVLPPVVTGNIQFTGNLGADANDGAIYAQQIKTIDESGNPQNSTIYFKKLGLNNWGVFIDNQPKTSTAATERDTTSNIADDVSVTNPDKYTGRIPQTWKVSYDGAQASPNSKYKIDIGDGKGFVPISEDSVVNNRYTKDGLEIKLPDTTDCTSSSVGLWTIKITPSTAEDYDVNFDINGNLLSANAYVPAEQVKMTPSQVGTVIPSDPNQLVQGLPVVSNPSGYTGTSDQTWKINFDGNQFTLDTGTGTQPITGLDSTTMKFTQDGLEIDLSNLVIPPGATGAWSFDVKAAQPIIPTAINGVMADQRVNIGSGRVNDTSTQAVDESKLLASLDFSKLTQLKDPSTAQVIPDGFLEGTLESFSVGSTGEINGVYSNGLIKVLGQLALAKFSNPSGLNRSGGNLFQETINSGSPDINVAGNGRGTIAAGSLEMSNVDLSEEFTDMITAQRGFQANTKIITTSDEILQELVNLKR